MDLILQKATCFWNYQVRACSQKTAGHDAKKYPPCNNFLIQRIAPIILKYTIFIILNLQDMCYTDEKTKSSVGKGLEPEM